MLHELSKKEKRLAREIFDKGIEAEFASGLQTAEKIINEWKNDELPNRAAYHKLHDFIRDHRKFIARRYDGLRGSDYIMIVAAIYHDKQITDEDLNGFSNETIAEIKRWQTMWEE